MKRVLSLILSIVMAVGMIAGMGAIEVSADSGWEDCYKVIIDEAVRRAESEDYENNADGRYGDGATAVSLYFLHDMNGDDIPELIVYNKDIINGGCSTSFLHMIYQKTKRSRCMRRKKILVREICTR